VRANRVTVAVPPAEVAAARARVGNGPVAVAPRQVGPAAVVSQACSRVNCPPPMRSGIALWNDWQGGVDDADCSLGFTATTTVGTPVSHWALTAGHCPGPVRTTCTPDVDCWRHGGRYIGPKRQAVCMAEAGADGCNGGAGLDVARIRIDNPNWLNSTWGWLFNANATDSPTPLDARADTDAQMPPLGSSACLQGQWSTQQGPNCGIFRQMYGRDGFAEVHGLAGCMGDSGGGWYLPAAGRRQALGIHRGALPNNWGEANCHTNGQSDVSFFTTLPRIIEYFDPAGGRIRVDTR